MRPLTIRGYCDPLTVSPGSDVTFHVSCDIPGPGTARLVRVILGDINPAGPGPRSVPVPDFDSIPFDGTTQRTNAGGHVIIPRLDVDESQGFTLHAFVLATIPGAGRQGVMGHWSEATREGWALTIEEGRLAFTVGDGTQTGLVRSSKALFPGIWYSVCASYDPQGSLTLSQTAIVGSCNGVFGPVVDLDGDSIDMSSKAPPIVVPSAPMTIGALLEEKASDRPWTVDHFAGKVEAPKLLSISTTDRTLVQALAKGEVPSSVVAHWDFSDGISRNGIPTSTVKDVAGTAHGYCVNTPDRAMTGRNWNDTEHHFIHAPEQYGAIWFHPDSIDDCRWEETLRLTLPDDLSSGIYALEVTQGRDTEYLVFFVRPRQGHRKAIAFLAPTFTYLAYANQQVAIQAAVAQSVFAHTAVLHDNEIEVHERSIEYGLSTYDYHVDGKGVQYSTWRRPIMNMRPQQRYCYSTLWNFTTDLHIINWMEAMGFDYDVITDHDLHDQGLELLNQYQVVVTGSHPEYYSTPMVNAWEQYISSGGRGMYLGGNGMYWVAVPNPENPHILEVRRGEQGDQGWRANPGEAFHSHSGEKGGLWRLRGRAAQRVWGVGYTSHAFGVSAPFYPMPDASDPRAAWIFEGIGAGEPIGDSGLIGNGASGHEFDRYDRALGTPPNTLLLASSFGHSQYDMVVPEDQFFPSSGMNGAEHPLVRGDITIYTSRNGGAVFAAPSMTWATSLPMNDYNNNVSKLTANILRRFSSSEPVAPIE